MIYPPIAETRRHRGFAEKTFEVGCSLRFLCASAVGLGFFRLLS